MSQRFAPRDISIIGDWMVSACVLAGRDPPPLADVVAKACDTVLHRLGVPHSDGFAAIREFQEDLLESGRIAVEPEPVAASAGGHVEEAGGSGERGGDEPRWQSSLNKLVVRVLDDGSSDLAAARQDSYEP